MKKIYFVRHQAHGIVSEFPFLKHPTQTQVEAVRKFCFNIHGFGHAKTPDQPYWTKVVEVNTVGDEVPEVPDRELTVVGKPGAATSSTSQFSVEGTGVITPAGKS